MSFCKINKSFLIFLLTTLFSAPSKTECLSSQVSNLQEAVKNVTYEIPQVTKALELSKNEVVLGSVDGNIYTLRDGVLINEKIKTAGSIYGALLKNKNNEIIVGNEEGELFFISKGKIKKKVKLDGAIIAKPIELSNENYFIGTTGEHSYIINKNAEVIKTIDIPGGVWADPYLTGDKKILVASSYENKVLLFSLSGEKSAEYVGEDVIRSSPVVLKNGNIVFGDNGNNVVVLKNEDEKLVKHSGHKAKDYFLSSALELSNGKFVIGSNDKNLYVFSEKGHFEKIVNLESEILGNPLQTKKGYVLVPSMSGDLHVLDGNLNLLKKIPVGGSLLNPVELEDGSIVIGSSEGKVVSLRIESYLGGKCSQAQTSVDDSLRGAKPGNIEENDRGDKKANSSDSQK